MNRKSVSTRRRRSNPPREPTQHRAVPRNLGFPAAMAGKGGKGLLAAKTTAAKSTDKDKKKAPVSRSSRAGLQVLLPFFLSFSDLVLPDLENYPDLVISPSNSRYI